MTTVEIERSVIQYYRVDIKDYEMHTSVYTTDINR